MNAGVLLKTQLGPFRKLLAAAALFLFYHLLHFRGRIGRVEFLAVQLLVCWPLVLIVIIHEWMALPQPLLFLTFTFSILYWLVGTFGASARRLHDLGKSGGYGVLLNFIWPLLLIWPGQKQDNKYGSRPSYRAGWGWSLLLWPFLLFVYELQVFLLN